MKIVIVGDGDVGYHFAEWLAQEKKEVVVIDIAPEALRRGALQGYAPPRAANGARL